MVILHRFLEFFAIISCFVPQSSPKGDRIRRNIVAHIDARSSGGASRIHRAVD